MGARVRVEEAAAGVAMTGDGAYGAAPNRNGAITCGREVELFQIEAGRFEYDLCVKYGGLREEQLDDKAAVAVALGKLLRAGLVALLERNTRRR